ncbi:hypothetical protein QVD17_34761 [Tagetes erecta]|uniref:Uncharacterized protein n=1 Tax=Tagetes erecta TaxID=13708 RepID=A0AAD8JYU4_TARER|nr:hypothetical protein QVD17_34761 [Tagetes erecta]
MDMTIQGDDEEIWQATTGIRAQASIDFENSLTWRKRSLEGWFGFSPLITDHAYCIDWKKAQGLIARTKPEGLFTVEGESRTKPEGLCTFVIDVCNKKAQGLII